jgi:hypothetical protein
MSAADRTLKAQLAGELRNLLEQRAGPNGMRMADLLDSINAQSSVRVNEHDLRIALVELEDFARVEHQTGRVMLRA